MEISKGTRASDAERERFVRTLGRHMADGRIDIEEYDRRVARVYAVETREELPAVLSDLPAAPVDLPEVPAADAGKTRPRFPIWQRIEGSAWLFVSVLVLAIWAIVSVSVGALTYFWPVWVIVPWGLVLAFRAVTGIEAGRCSRRAV